MNQKDHIEEQKDHLKAAHIVMDKIMGAIDIGTPNTVVYTVFISVIVTMCHDNGATLEEFDWLLSKLRKAYKNLCEGTNEKETP